MLGGDLSIGMWAAEVGKKAEQIYDKDSGEEITCSFCDEAEDCPHRLAVMDRTFCECDSGYCVDR